MSNTIITNSNFNPYLYKVVQLTSDEIERADDLADNEKMSCLKTVLFHLWDDWKHKGYLGTIISEENFQNLLTYYTADVTFEKNLETIKEHSFLMSSITNTDTSVMLDILEWTLEQKLLPKN